MPPATGGSGAQQAGAVSWTIAVSGLPRLSRGSCSYYGRGAVVAGICLRNKEQHRDRHCQSDHYGDEDHGTTNRAHPRDGADHLAGDGDHKRP